MGPEDKKLGIVLFFFTGGNYLMQNIEYPDTPCVICIFFNFLQLRAVRIITPLARA